MILGMLPFPASVFLLLLRAVFSCAWDKKKEENRFTVKCKIHLLWSWNNYIMAELKTTKQSENAFAVDNNRIAGM